MTADPAADPPPTTGAGRPSTYSEALGTVIAERVMDGESLRAICRSDGMPNRGTVLRWLAAEPGFRMLYRQARALACEFMADELVEIADDSSGDFEANSRGEMVPNPEAVARSRLRIETRKWVMARMHRAMWGDRPAEDAAGAAPASPMLPLDPATGAPVIGPTPDRLLSAEQRAAVAQALAQKYRLIEQDADAAR